MNQRAPAIQSATPQGSATIQLAGQSVPIAYHRHPRAKRYILTVSAQGTVRVTIPRRGSRAEAERFVSSRQSWLERAWRRTSALLAARAQIAATEILFRGHSVPWRVETSGEASVVWLENERIVVRPDMEPRLAVETLLRRLANHELPQRVAQLAAHHGCVVRRVSIRNQRSRWGSCSPRGTISLNWRLIQAPPEVRDYVITHELMHLREMNHSPRFWSHLRAACPDYKNAERWLKQHGPLLHR